MDCHTMLQQHYNISKRYNMINRCLSLMRHSQIDAIEKIKIETLLIRMKIHLLDTPSHSERAGGRLSDEDFETLLRQIQSISNGICHHTAVYDVLRHVTGVLNSLSYKDGAA